MREGRYRDAEEAYLKALEESPNDPDVHYNLGILYDDHLKNDEKAALHYRKYLKLNPYGQDVDQVKSWLMQLEVGGESARE
jgi:tetratricopeptide (TPR) repeat protein